MYARRWRFRHEVRPHFFRTPNAFNRREKLPGQPGQSVK